MSFHLCLPSLLPLLLCVCRTDSPGMVLFVCGPRCGIVQYVLGESALCFVRRAMLDAG